MGRTSDARERLVAAATELFSERAYGAVGIAEIASRAGVQKGSFYYFFSSKEALALAVIDQHWAWQRGQWEQVLKSERCCGESGTLGVTRPDVSTQVRFRKEEEIKKGEAKLRASGAVAAQDNVKILTISPTCIQGLNRY